MTSFKPDDLNSRSK